MLRTEIPGNYCPECSTQLAFEMPQDGPARIICSDDSCLRPAAASEVLADRETGHIVTIRDDDFDVLHPLRERRDELTTCSLHLSVKDWDSLRVPVGTYRVPATVTGADPDEWEHISD